MNWIKTEMAEVTNLRRQAGTLADVVRGADVFIGVSQPGLLTGDMVRTMHRDAIVFACANPTPEIFPDEARAAGAAVVSTGRSDYPNQINNVLIFPGLFKGALAARAKRITEEMKTAAAYALAEIIPEEELKKLTHSAYTGTFETEEIVPVKTISQAFSMAEMFHGRTCAFKDLALSLFPYLLVYAKKEEKDGKEILILTATSGDTGKAALEGFRDVPGVHIMVFYPSHGVSPLQKDQMQKQLGSNVKVVGIEGNFDDAQTGVKKVFGDKAIAAELEQRVKIVEMLNKDGLIAGLEERLNRLKKEDDAHEKQSAA